MTRTTLKRAFRDSLPILAGYLALGMGFGVMLQSKGYSFWWAILMSCTMFAGSGQYAGVDFLASGASILTTAVMTFIINARHFFYGFSLLDKYKGAGILKPYMIFGLTDETYSIVCSAQLDENINPKKYYFFLTALNHSYWITGCKGASSGSARNCHNRVVPRYLRRGHVHYPEHGFNCLGAFAVSQKAR